MVQPPVKRAESANAFVKSGTGDRVELKVIVAFSPWGHSV